MYLTRPPNGDGSRFQEQFQKAVPSADLFHRKESAYPLPERFNLKPTWAIRGK